MKKAFLTFALTATCIFGSLLGLGHTVKAASTSNNYTTFNVSTYANGKKVGKFYINNKYVDYTIRKSQKGKVLYTIKKTSGTLSTNGTYAFYINDKDHCLYRTTLASKKTTRLAKMKGNGYYVSHVYGSSIYLNHCNSDESCTIKVYNMGKKTMNTVITNACPEPVSGSGSSLVYQSMSNGNVYLRNCASGKVTTLGSLKDATTFKVCGNKIAFTKYNNTKHQYTVYTYNINTGKVTTIKNVGSSYEAGHGEFTDNLGKYAYGKKVLSLH